MVKKAERRLIQRYPFYLPIKEINGRPAEGIFLLDFSAMGARLEAPFPFPILDQVDISFSLPGEETDLRMEGDIIWIYPAGAKPNIYHLGVSFLAPRWDLDQLARDKLCPME